MLSKTKQQKIKQIIGWGYASKIQNYLTKCKTFNSKGMPYSTNSIRNIFTGKEENTEVLEKIIEYYNIEKERQEKLKDSIDNIDK